MPFRLRTARFSRRTQKIKPALQLSPTPDRTPIRNEALAYI